MKTSIRHNQFLSPSRWPLLLVWLSLLGVLCLAFGCANTPKRTGFAKSKAKAERAAAARAAAGGGEAFEDEMDDLEVGAPLKAFRINPDYGWVVVRSGRTLIPGERFSAWHADEETAKLVVDERSRHPYYILEVTAGEPHPDDTYVPATE